MHASELDRARSADQPALPTLPLLCDQCRATGVAGDPLFEAVPDILGFAPVPRRARASGWTAEHQRAFIAALALTGSARQAARTIGRHAFGAEQLRTARGGRSFAEAWDAALELAREREFRRIHANLAELAEQEEAANAATPRAAAAAGPRPLGDIHPDCPYDPDGHMDDYPEVWEATVGVRHRLTQCRRLFLASIAHDADKRAAFELLAGPADWDAALALAPQPREAPLDPADPEAGMPNMKNADMVLTVADGWLPDMSGDPPNPTLLFFQALGKGAESLTGEERDAIAAEIDTLVAAGWVQRPDGSWHQPAPKAKRKRKAPTTPRIRTFD